MTSKKAVDGFFAHRKIAVVGVTRQSLGFGQVVWRTLRGKGWDAVPVNPNMQEVGGVPCLANLRDLPAGTVEAAVVITPPAVTERVVEDAAAAGIRWLWLQQGCGSDKAVQYCRDHGIEVVNGECVLMYAEPKGLHNFHRWVWSVIGKAPQ